MHTHERAGEHTLPRGAHTSTAHAAVLRGDHREEPEAGPGSLSRRAPTKACATGGRSSPPRPAKAGCSARRAAGRGVSQSPAALGAEGLGGARPWGRGPGAYKIALRHGHKQTLPGYPLELQADCSPISVSLCTSRWALHLQPCCRLCSVLPCSLGKPSGRLPPGQDKDLSLRGATGLPARVLWPLRRPQLVVFGGAGVDPGGIEGITGAGFDYYKAEKGVGSRFLSNWGSGIRGLKLGRKA